MSYTSGLFFIFLLTLIVVYFVVPKRFQWIVLLLGSYIFYLAANPVSALFLVVTTISVFYCARWIGKEEERFSREVSANAETLTREQKKHIRNKSRRKKKLILIGALILNFGILFSLKYFNFFANSTTYLFNILSIDATIPRLDLLLPLGISFYTFQSTGYLIDVFRGKVKPDENIAKFALFVSFFPQIVQGPIGRHDELAQQLYGSHEFDYTRAKFGLQLALWGLFKKMVIADRAAILVDEVFGNFAAYEGVTIFSGVFLYCVQIYGDFSGGIDISRGMAQIMGINLRENFKQPFFATSIADFWRRWHISLSEWMRDYIFYPLSLSHSFAALGKSTRRVFGSRLGKLIPIFLAQLITFLFVGIWHGANWTFVFFGLYNGLFIILGILTEQPLNRFKGRHNISLTGIGWRVVNVLITFVLVVIARYFSRAPDLVTALRMLKRTALTFFPIDISGGIFTEMGLNEKNLQLLVVVLLVLFLVELLQERGVQLREKIAKQHVLVRWAIYFIAVFSILIFGMYGINYVATDFIYMGF